MSGEARIVRIASDVKLGKNVKLHPFVKLRGCEIGDNTRIGTFVEIQKGAKVGADCKISSYVAICEGVIIEDGVFIGHGVTFVNEFDHGGAGQGGDGPTRADRIRLPAVVRKGASIGSNSRILAGVTIGEGSMVGARSVLDCDVPMNTIVVGNPAHIVGSTR